MKLLIFLTTKLKLEPSRHEGEKRKLVVQVVQVALVVKGVVQTKDRVVGSKEVAQSMASTKPKDAARSRFHR